MTDERTIAEFHRDRESGDGCPETEGGPHYFAFIDNAVDYRLCIDCGAPEPALWEWNMTEPKVLNTDRIRNFYVTATAWAMPGAYREKPKREARLAVVRERQRSEFDSWLEEHDRKIAHDAWEACSRRWIELNPGVPVAPEGEADQCCVGEHYCDLASSPVVPHD